MTERSFTTRRQGILSALATKLKEINGTGEFLSNVNDNVSPRLLFWDEVDEFPAVHLNAGSETREYLGGGHKHRFLTVTVRCYVKEDDSVTALDELLEDVETVLETNSRLAYKDRQGNDAVTQQITIISVDTVSYTHLRAHET